MNEETYKTNVTKNPDDMFRKLGKTTNEINYARTEYIRNANKYYKN